MTDFQGKGKFTPVDAVAFFGMDLIKFGDCARWLVSRLHPKGAKCPCCSVEITDKDRLERFRTMEQIRCRKCGKKFTAKTGTILNETKLEAREIYLLAVLIYLEVSPAHIAAILRVHTDTVRNWQTKFQALAEVAGA
jgi:transposase-like protein